MRAAILPTMLPHRYGPDLLVMDDPYLLTLLARLGSPETGTESLPALVRSAYGRLAHEVNEFGFG